MALDFLSRMTRSWFLSGGQKAAAAGTLVAATAATAAASAAVGAHPSPVVSLAIVTAQCAIADAVATKVRHPLAALDWMGFGRGGHVFGVGLGLGATFGPLASVIEAMAQELPEALADSRGNIAFWLKLVLGILPWVYTDTALNPAHEGHRGEVAVAETVRTMAGSALATVLEPAAGGVFKMILGSEPGFLRALADQLTTVTGYLFVLVAGWLDFGIGGLSEAERARNRATT